MQVLRRFKRPNVASMIVLAVVALALAIGGTATAAKLITSKNIKNGTIKAVDISTSAKQSLRGQKGNTGPQGPQGAQGPAGPSAVARITVVDSPQAAFGPTDVVMSAIAFCPAGQLAVSGGGVSISDEELAATQATDSRDGWFVIGVDETDDGGEYVQARALCAPAGVAVAASGSSRE